VNRVKGLATDSGHPIAIDEALGLTNRGTGNFFGRRLFSDACHDESPRATEDLKSDVALRKLYASLA
jgi:hypothetical protein